MTGDPVRTGPLSNRYLVGPGPKPAVGPLGAAVSTDSPIATETATKVLRAGGNAADAGIAAAMVQAAVEPHMTNHAGLVSLLYFDASSGRIHHLDAQGAHPSGLSPFRPVPPGYGFDSSALIPGFMPGLKAIHERFATRPWAELCEDAVEWATTGHPVTSYEYQTNVLKLPFLSYFPESRRFFLPDGHLPNVGQTLVPRGLADTLRGVRDEGPDYMIDGPWAREFVATANRMGWPISLAHMVETPPRWIDPVTFAYHGREIVSVGPPQAQAFVTAVSLGVLTHLGIREMTPGSADHIWAMAQALRQGGRHYEFAQDPTIYEVPVDEVMDDGYHAHLAQMIRRTRPRVDLTEHIRLTGGSPGPASTLFGGHPMSGSPSMASIDNPPPIGSCEIAIVDHAGNWLQMMNTLQGSGIPGQVVGGVPMVGSTATFGHLQSPMDSTLVPGAKLRSVVGSTLVLEGGRPILSAGTPGLPHVAVPQVLAYLLDFGFDVRSAIDAVRMYPMSESRGVVIEDGLDPGVVEALHRLGTKVGVVPRYDPRLGSFSVITRDPSSGHYLTAADPRRGAVVGGIPA